MSIDTKLKDLGRSWCLKRKEKKKEKKGGECIFGKREKFYFENIGSSSMLGRSISQGGNGAPKTMLNRTTKEGGKHWTCSLCNNKGRGETILDKYNCEWKQIKYNSE